MRKLLFTLCYLGALHVAAQDLWYDGAVVTAEDEILTGKILYNPWYDLVVIRSGEETSVVTSSKLKSFRYFDQAANINRKFLTVPESGRAAQIYEVVLYGAVPVVRKVKALCGSAPSAEDGYNYYFMQNGEVKSLRKFRQSLYPQIHSLLVDEESRQQLNPNDSADAIRLIQIYNGFHFTASASRR